MSSNLPPPSRHVLTLQHLFFNPHQQNATSNGPHHPIPHNSMHHQKMHSPRTVFNTENGNMHHTSTLTIFPHQYPLLESSITTLPTTIPIRNTHHGQKPHGKASQRAILRHPSRKDSFTYRFLQNATTSPITTTTQEIFTRVTT